MKLMWFHLMPYTELPDDFRQKHPSVWVDIHSSLFDPKRAHHMYNDFMDELEYAAECGFDAICVNEHHSNGYGLMPSPNLIASALARRTTDTAMCVMGNSLALYNPPTRVAEEFAMIDCISGGRLIAGFPVGTPMDTCYAYGQNPSMLRERYLEAHDLVMQAWTEKETFAFNGRFNQQRYVNIWPRPVQQPHPPVWIPGGGSVETWHWCAEMDYVYCYLSYYGYKAGSATMKGFWDEMDGSARTAIRIAPASCSSSASPKAARRRWSATAEAAEYFYGRCLHVDSRFASPPGYNTEATQRVGLESQVKQAATGRRGRQARTRSAARHDRHHGRHALQHGGARDERHRRARLCHRRLAEGRRRAARARRHVAQCRPPHAAAAVRQHVQGADQVQHQAVRREGDAEARETVLRVGGQVVAEADGTIGARGTPGFPARNGGRSGVERSSLGRTGKNRGAKH